MTVWHVSLCDYKRGASPVFAVSHCLCCLHRRRNEVGTVDPRGKPADKAKRSWTGRNRTIAATGPMRDNEVVAASLQTYSQAAYRLAAEWRR